MLIHSRIRMSIDMRRMSSVKSSILNCCRDCTTYSDILYWKLGAIKRLLDVSINEHVEYSTKRTRFSSGIPVTFQAHGWLHVCQYNGIDREDKRLVGYGLVHRVTRLAQGEE